MESLHRRHGRLKALHERAQIGSRVPADALALTATILEDDPQRFPDFDAKGARDAIAYLQAMDKVASELRSALGRVEKSAAKRRKAAADVTLTLYAMLKGLERIGLAGKQGTQLGRLRKLLTTYRVPASLKVTQKEVQADVKKAKAVKMSKQAGANAAAARAKASEAAAESELALARRKHESGF